MTKTETGGAFPAWQPIATAPKDGTSILVCVLPAAMFVAWWQNGDSQEFASG